MDGRGGMESQEGCRGGRRRMLERGEQGWFPASQWVVGQLMVGKSAQKQASEGRGREGTQKTYHISFWKEDLFPQTLSLLMAESRSCSPAPGL